MEGEENANKKPSIAESISRHPHIVLAVIAVLVLVIVWLFVVNSPWFASLSGKKAKPKAKEKQQRREVERESQDDDSEEIEDLLAEINEV